MRNAYTVGETSPEINVLVSTFASRADKNRVRVDPELELGKGGGVTPRRARCQSGRLSGSDREAPA